MQTDCGVLWYKTKVFLFDLNEMLRGNVLYFLLKIALIDQVTLNASEFFNQYIEVY